MTRDYTATNKTLKRDYTYDIEGKAPIWYDQNNALYVSCGPNHIYMKKCAG